MPTVFCHRLVIDERPHRRTTGSASTTRSDTPSRHCQHLNYRVIAAGDSYNDTSMLGAADRGFLFKSPANVRAEFPQFTAVDEFDDLLPLILAELG